MVFGGGISSSIETSKYILIYCPNHPRGMGAGGTSKTKDYVLQHILVAEAALGKLIPFVHPIHHVNENGKDNSNTNLVICENQAYHKLLHSKMRILQLGGNPHQDKFCGGCKQVKPKNAFSFNLNRYDHYQNYCKDCSKKIRKVG